MADASNISEDDFHAEDEPSTESGSGSRTMLIGVAAVAVAVVLVIGCIMFGNRAPVPEKTAVLEPAQASASAGDDKKEAIATREPSEEGGNMLANYDASKENISLLSPEDEMRFDDMRSYGARGGGKRVALHMYNLNKSGRWEAARRRKYLYESLGGFVQGDVCRSTRDFKKYKANQFSRGDQCEVKEIDMQYRQVRLVCHARIPGGSNLDFEPYQRKQLWLSADQFEQIFQPIITRNADGIETDMEKEDRLGANRKRWQTGQQGEKDVRTRYEGNGVLGERDQDKALSKMHGRMHKRVHGKRHRKEVTWKDADGKKHTDVYNARGTGGRSAWKGQDRNKLA